MEKSYQSRSNQALEFAKTTLNRLIKEECDASIILRSCYAIASLSGDQENKDWINRELNGYKKKDKIPKYRKFINKFKGKFDVDETIHRIEHKVKLKGNLTIWRSKKGKKFEESFELPPEWGYTIISRVKDRCLNFLIDIVTKLQYSGEMTSLISSIQKEVNEKIININPEIDTEIQSISNNIVSEDSEKLSKVAHSCRRILKLLADKVFPPSNEPFIDSEGKSHSIKEDAYMNRLLMFLEKNKGDKLIKNEIKYLTPIFDWIRESAGKGVHSNISKFETEKIFIHTYLIVAEILRLIGLEEDIKLN